MQSKSQSKPSAASTTVAAYSQKKSSDENDSLLQDQAAPPTQLLQDMVQAKVSFRKTEAVVGCNCDRWGHPCPECVERNHPPKAGTPILSPVKQ